MGKNVGYFDGRNLIMDGYSSRVLDILYSKYSGEYTTFFGELLKTYDRGPVKLRISGTLELISEVKSIIEEVLLSGEIKKDQEKALYNAIDRIESDKQGLIDQMEEVSTFREEIDRVTETTGVSINQLNITKKLAKRGFGRSGNKRSNDIMPRTRKMAKSLWEGTKIAAMGPFFPLLDIASDVVDEVKKFGSKKESYNTNESNRTGELSGGQNFVSGFHGVSQQYSRHESLSSLFMFFNDKAYKAKWTRELIERIRKIQPTGYDSGKIGVGLPTVGSVTDLFKTGIISGFKAAGVAGAFAFAGYEMYQAFKKSGELSDVSRKAGSAAVGLERQSNLIESKIKESGGISNYASKRGISSSELIKELSENRLASQKARSVEYSGTPYGKFESILDSIGVFGKPFKAVKGAVEKVTGFKPKVPTVQPIQEITKEYERKFSSIPVKPLDNMDIERFSKELSRGISSGITTILNDIRRNDANKVQPVVKLPSTGNRYDAADPLINMHSNGMLTIGDQ